jgi:hypothetical protein
MAATTKMPVFWVVAIAPMTGAAGTCKTSVNFYKTIRCNNPEDSHIETKMFG